MKLPVHALVYYSKQDRRYVAECYELGQVSLGDSIKEARNDLVRAVELVAESVEQDSSIILFDGKASKRLKRGLEKVFGKQTPNVEKTKHFKIYFWKER